MPAPIESIFFDGKNDWGTKTFDGSSNPRNSDANRAGKSFDVMDSMTVVVCVSPATASTNA